MAHIGFGTKLKAFFTGKSAIDDDFFDELCDLLIEGDVGIKTAMEFTDDLRKKRFESTDEVMTALAETLRACVKTCDLKPAPDAVSVYLVLGVNGVGKTTSIAKLAQHYAQKDFPIVLAAADTFRAAAIEQLTYHAEKLDLRIIAHKAGGDPGAVVFDAGEAVKAKGSGLVLADTAGRLHNKDNLVRELQKINKIAASKASPDCYKKILVLDACSGQNALRQAEVFHNAVGVDAIILTKYDSQARGGIAITAGKELGIPVAFVGTGEHYEDLQTFDPERYITDFLQP